MKLVNVLSGDIVRESDNLEELKALGVSIALREGAQSTHWSFEDASNHRISGKRALSLRDEEGAIYRIFLPK
ncbi:hypothetical protein G5S52_08150 [Grimontia sp. S25]|uniref:Uncharacterized protein n=1 Tax=Grimontia sedimenti TaxID=2711294 RepID=A0A6M1RH80_9GAMM|nr:hypothetical protein [Grimontia sedimenti]NGN97641.1 hypothetical protein [Grimontia sedimenti]